MTSTVVKAADAAQFLSFLPRMLGYRPFRSLVVVPFHGPRSLGAMRFDLPTTGDDPVDAIAATVIGTVCRLPDADAVAAIVYTDARFADGGRMPHRALLRAVERRADACGLRTADLLCVAADAWGSALDPECPPTGRALEELETDDPRLAELPLPRGDQLAGSELPPGSARDRRAVATALRALEEAIGTLCGQDPDADGPVRDGLGEPSFEDVTLPADLGPVPGPLDDGLTDEGPADPPARVDPRALATACRLDDLPGFFEDVLTTAEPDAYETAAVVWCLSRPSLRDVALVQWSGNVSEGDEALDAQLRWEDGEDYPAHLAARMWGEGDRPQPARLEDALALTRHAAALAPRELRPGPLAMCAWLAWALGRSTHAWAYADRAYEIDPEHGLAQILLSFVHAGHLPEWAFRHGSAG
ncbi:DUF4192 family protein [Microbacterium timonense]|uniref:DUF4192 family protein n=1 Tax=Microbacterium timonense TaxID=2086576 RepID=UPI000D10A065|nr:DUF4192 family protein [Microbacterium timonense]